MQRGGRRWSFLTLGSTDKVGVVFYCEFFCLFAAFLVSSCWLPSMWGLSFPCCLAVFPPTWETATQASHSALTEGANSWTMVLLTANDKKFLQAWLILLYSVYRDPSWLNLPLTLRKKQEKSLLSTEQKNLPCFCAILYMLIMQHSPYWFLLVVCQLIQSRHISPKPTPYFQIISLPLWACVS